MLEHTTLEGFPRPRCRLFPYKRKPEAEGETPEEAVVALEKGTWCHFCREKLKAWEMRALQQAQESSRSRRRQ